MGIQGVTGEALRGILQDALRTYVHGVDVDVPTVEQCDGWVLSRTNGLHGHHSCRWSLATRTETEQAPRGCPALADGCYQYFASKYYHPSLRALREICELIAA